MAGQNYWVRKTSGPAPPDKPADFGAFRGPLGPFGGGAKQAAQVFAAGRGIQPGQTMDVDVGTHSPPFYDLSELARLRVTRDHGGNYSIEPHPVQYDEDHQALDAGEGDDDPDQTLDLRRRKPR